MVVVIVGSEMGSEDTASIKTISRATNGVKIKKMSF